MRKVSVVIALYVAGFGAVLSAFALCGKPGLQAHWFPGPWTKFSGSYPEAAYLLFAVGAICLAAGYWLFLRDSLGAAVPTLRHRLLPVFLGLSFLAMPPFLSSDVHNYYQSGWVAVVKDANPYKVPPSAFDDFPAREETGGYNRSSLLPYGPLWAWTASAAVVASGGNIKVGVLLLRIAAFLSFLAGLFFVSRIALLVHAESEATALVFFGTNPLVLMEGPAMGHNDLMAIALVLLSVWLLLRFSRRQWAGIFALMTAMMIKVTAAPALLVVLYGGARNARSLGAVFLDWGKAVVPAALVLAVASAPFLEKASALPAMFGFGRGDVGYEISLSLMNLSRNTAVALFDVLAPGISSRGIEITVTLALLAAGGAAVLYLVNGARTPAALFGRLGMVYLVATLLVGNWRQWYVLWPVALAAIDPLSRSSRVIALYSLLAMATYLLTRSSGVYCVIM